MSVNLAKYKKEKLEETSKETVELFPFPMGYLSSGRESITLLGLLGQQISHQSQDKHTRQQESTPVFERFT